MDRKQDCQHFRMKPTPNDDGVGCTECGRTWTIPEFIGWLQRLREVVRDWRRAES